RFLYQDGCRVPAAQRDDRAANQIGPWIAPGAFKQACRGRTPGKPHIQQPRANALVGVQPRHARGFSHRHAHERFSVFHGFRLRLHGRAKNPLTPYDMRGGRNMTMRRADGLRRRRAAGRKKEKWRDNKEKNKEFMIKWRKNTILWSELRKMWKMKSERQNRPGERRAPVFCAPTLLLTRIPSIMKTGKKAQDLQRSDWMQE